MSEYSIKIFADDCADNPRNWSNWGKIFCDNNRYINNETDMDFDDFYSGNFEKDVKRLEKMGYIVFPLCVYDHSLVKIYIGDPCCQWDSGRIGFYLVDKKEVLKNYGRKKINKEILDRVEKAVEGEMETLTSWINGDVYGYRLFEDGEEIDSCWGFYGYDCLADMLDNMPIDLTLEEAEAITDREF